MVTEQVTQQDLYDKPKIEKSKLYYNLVKIFALMGVLGVLFGFIHIYGIFSSGFTNMRLADAIINIIIGVLAYICSRVLAKGRSLVIIIYGGSVLLSMMYSFAVGRGFNYIMAIVGVYFIWQLNTHRKLGEIL